MALPAPTSFIELLRLIVNGDSVDAATINKILRDLDSNDRFLRSLIDALEAGTALYRREATVDSSVKIGQPVYFNSTTQQYEQGLAQALVTSGVLSTSPASQLWGICSYKYNSTKADILLQGYAQLDLTEATGASPAAGLYFLSGTTAGKLTLQEPPVSVPVLFYDGSGGVYVRPSFADIYAAHQHYKVVLQCVPAGDFSLVSGHYEITGADTAVEGWLPADDPSFDGHAPAGAKFGYNLAASTLANAWPPLPLSGAVLDFVDGAGLTQFPVQTGVAVIDTFGIWWMEDCPDFIPWPSDYNVSTTTTTTLPPDCPPTLPVSLTLWYTRPKFQTSKTVVTSLRPAENSVITIRCLNGDNEDQTTGNLEIDADLALLLAEATDTAGSTVLKGITGGKFTRGPVVEKLKSGGSNVILASTGGADGSGYHHGGITITVPQNLLGAELPIEDVRLQGVTLEDYQDVLALGFPQNQLSSFRGIVNVPYDLGVTTLTLGLRFWFLARAGGALPALTLTARVILRPDAVATLPTSDSAVTLTMPGTVLTEDQYLEVTSGNITAPPGSLVQFTLTRDDSGAGDGFNGDIHVLRQRAVLTGAT